MDAAQIKDAIDPVKGEKAARNDPDWVDQLKPVVDVELVGLFGLGTLLNDNSLVFSFTIES